MADDAGEKTEEATQQRREDFRKRGQVAQTKEFGSFLLLIGACLCIWMLGGFFLDQVRELYEYIIGDFLVESVRNSDYKTVATFAIQKSLLILAPVLGLSFILSALSSLLQIGFLYNEEALQFKIEKLNPVSGFKRIFSMRSLVEGLKAVAKVLIVGSIVALIVRDELVRVPFLIEYSVEQLFSYFGDISLKLLGTVGIFMGVLAALDYGFQRFDLEKQMRMSKQEVKEEHKNREGDPLLKAKIRRQQREMANKRMMSDVPKADVIITNPTHIAVAIQYIPGTLAPVILAMGADKTAEKIKEIARENNIAIVENKPLARTIYKTLKVGHLIPRELFQAVAEVLAYVYRLKNRMMN